MLVGGGRFAKYVRAPQEYVNLLNTFIVRTSFTYMYHMSWLEQQTQVK